MIRCPAIDGVVALIIREPSARSNGPPGSRPSRITPGAQPTMVVIDLITIARTVPDSRLIEEARVATTVSSITRLAGVGFEAAGHELPPRCHRPGSRGRAGGR